MKPILLPLLTCMLFATTLNAQEPPPPPQQPVAPEQTAEPVAVEPVADGAEADPGFAPVPEPPDLPSRLEDGQPIEPQVTIVRKKDAVVEEYRANGRMFMVKVTPKVGLPYYLLDRDGDGRMESRMSKISEEFAVPQWVIFSW
jgi:Protein of unknown function (DUF2782)